MSHLDDCTIYRFVRGDLCEEDQCVQGGHVIFKMATLLTPGYGTPRIVDLDGGSSAKAFGKTLRKLEQAQIVHSAYDDPDHADWGITAICTEPLTKEQSLPLANYRLRRYSPPSVASAEVALNGQRGASSNASVAQTGNTEHSATNREVAGAIPAGSSSSVVSRPPARRNTAVV